MARIVKYELRPHGVVRLTIRSIFGVERKIRIFKTKYGFWKHLDGTGHYTGCNYCLDKFLEMSTKEYTI